MITDQNSPNEVSNNLLQGSLLKKLPQEIILIIARQLVLEDVTHFSKTEKELHSLLEDSSIWESLLHVDFPSAYEEYLRLKENNNMLNPKDYYKKNHEVSYAGFTPELKKLMSLVKANPQTDALIVDQLRKDPGLIIGVFYHHENTKDKYSPFKWAVANGNLALVQKFIEMGIRSIHVGNLEENNVFNDALLIAAKYGHLNLVQFFLLNVNVNYSPSTFDEWGTPLGYAAENNHLDVFNELIINGADINLLHHGEFPLTYLIKHNQIGIAMKFILEDRAPASKFKQL
jgi:ankyrin repeat protein